MKARLSLQLVWACGLALIVVLLGSAVQGASAVAASAPLPAPAGAPADVGAELPGLRSEFSRTYLSKRDGFVRLVSAAPLNYRDASGAWEPIDDTLAASGNGYTNTANSYSVSLPASLAAPVVYHRGAASATMQLVGAAGTAAVSGATATYQDALPSVSVSLTAGPAAVKESLTLADASAPTSFSYALSLSSGLSAVQERGGPVVVHDSSGAFVFGLARPFMRDNAGALSEAVTVTLTGSAPTYTLSVALDKSWLSAGRSWPVTVDPTWFSDTSTFIESGNPTTSYDGWGSLYVGSDGAGNLARGLVHFDLSSLPAGMQIEHAQLELYQYNYAWCECTGSVDVDGLTSPFTADATWNTRDGVNAWNSAGGDYTGPVATEQVATTSGWYDWQVSDPVRQWYEGAPNDGFLLKASDESSNTKLSEFYSSTASEDTPELWITYQPRVGLRSIYTYQGFPISDQVQASVNVGNGNLVVAAHDLSVSGVAGFDLDLTHYYNSIDANLDGESDANTSGEAGAHWSFLPECYIWSDGSLGYQDATGYEATFGSTPSGGWTQPDGIDATVSADPSDPGWDLLTFDRSGIRDECKSGLGTTKDRNGNGFAYYLSGSELLNINDTTRNQQDVSATYNSSGLLAQLKDYTSRAWQYGYNGNGDLTSITNPLSQTTSYGYDTDHQLTSISNPDGDETDFTYTADHQVATVTSGLQNGSCPSGATCPVTQFSYPASLDGNCSGLANASGETIVTDPRSNKWTYCYDNRLRVIKTVDPDGHTSTTDYASGTNNCADDNPCSATDALGKTTSFGYNPAGGVCNGSGSSTIQPGENLCWSQSPLETSGNRPTSYYNDTNNPYAPSQYTDPEYSSTGGGKHSWLYSYDPNGNLASKSEGDTAPGQNPVKFTYNTDGTLNNATDSKGNVTSYCYSTSYSGGPACPAANTHNLTGIIPPAPLGQVILSYDSLNRIHTITDGKGQTRTYSYDNLDRVTQIAYTGGPTLSFGYDSEGNLTSQTDPTGSTSYHYNTLNQLTEEDQPGGHTITYSYDPNGNLASLTDAEGTTNYQYTPENEVSTLLEPGASTPISFAYNPDGNRTQIHYPNGVYECLVYDDAQRLTQVRGQTGTDCTATGTILTNFTYSYSAAGVDTDLRQSMSAQYPGGTPTTTYYCYDGLARLTSADTTSASCPNSNAAYQYSYDTTGNLTSKTIDGTTTSYTVNNANELTNSGDSYDANGAMTADPGTYTNATYNPLEQTSAITPSGGSQRGFAYTGLGQARRVTNGTISQINDQLGLSEDTGTPNTFYTRDPDGTILGERRNGQSYYFLQDGLGSTAAVTDSTGNVVVSYHYDPYGTTTCTPGTSPCSFYEPIRYAGGYDDNNTTGGEQLYKFGQRYYDPGIGRWTQIDPADNPLDLHGWNQYTYAGNDPINAVDPSGMGSCGPGSYAQYWPQGDMQPACDWHDSCYGGRGAFYGVTRSECDADFRAYADYLCESNSDPYCAVMTVIDSAILRLGGRFYSGYRNGHYAECRRRGGGAAFCARHTAWMFSH